MDDFLKTAGWGGATRTPMTPDWSPRQYWRLTKPDGATAVLLQGPEAAIAGHGLPDFMHFTTILQNMGLSAPVVYAADLPHNFLLIEDFGETPIDVPAIEHEAYALAVDALAVLGTGDATRLTHYKQGYIFKKLALFSDDTAWMQAWEAAEATLPPAPYVFSHMDYKAGNLHWLPERDGIKRIGILDFQAAQNAPFTYDIVNLLEDARRNLTSELKASLKTQFKKSLPLDWQTIFDDWYIFMAAQFHARVLGQIRLMPSAAPDIAPRLETYLRAELGHERFDTIRRMVF